MGKTVITLEIHINFNTADISINRSGCNLAFLQSDGPIFHCCFQISLHAARHFGDYSGIQEIVVCFMISSYWKNNIVTVLFTFEPMKN